MPKQMSDLADTNGFKLSSSKTVCFCRLHKLHHDPELTLKGSAISVVEETKFIGIIFDRKLSFLPHIRHLKDKCTKALNLLRVVVYTTWGADQQTLIHLYRSLIRSKLDYGYVVYAGSDPKSCTSSLPWCLSNVAIFQFICISE